MKKISLALATVMLLCLLAGCGEKTPEVTEPDMTKVSSAVSKVIKNENFTDIPDSYVETMLKLTADSYAERDAKISSVGTNIDEYGIFKAADAEQVAAIEKALNEYLQYRMDIWMEEYLPEEFPKLENAKVFVNGNYVIYAIVDSNTLKNAENAFNTVFGK